ncbi:MAG: cob(I)yrinic acid a,c-diamide adenosyltransferase [Spirochaetae bacterium HGW-Spirochaetae-1]|jgi:cob(I)alamin adenosyltransferase|nr:MAG: cob(I)yrinic acid a,c-diamide adenosyltransferase [Spirochaetae bacterium HGW-Spirochaetae-1]
MAIGQGYVQLYTGDGKGKTTAALGLALRAAGAGLKTLMIQFMKGQDYAELHSIKTLGPAITIEQYGSDRFCMPDGTNFHEHYDLARRGYERARKALTGGEYDILILDEIVTAQKFKLVTGEEIAGLVRAKPAGMELVLTGRGATEDLMELCDLVTEMKEIKHYYREKIQARSGIEF